MLRAADRLQPSSRIGCARTWVAATRPAAASGAWTTKIARQPSAWVTAPPSAGPSEAAKVPVSVQIVAPRSAEPVSDTRSGRNGAGRAPAPPRGGGPPAPRTHSLGGAPPAPGGARKRPPPPTTPFF